MLTETLVCLAVVGIALLLHRIHQHRNTAEEIVERSFEAARETVPEFQGTVLRREIARIGKLLNAIELQIPVLRERLEYLSRMMATLPKSVAAAHRTLLARSFLLFDALAQAAIRVANRQDQEAVLIPILTGTAMTLLYAALGGMMTGLVVLLFRRRPPMAWTLLDGLALASGGTAVAIAIAFFVASGITDIAASDTISHWMDLVGTPAIMLGGFAAGLLAGVGHQQSEPERLRATLEDLGDQAEVFRQGLLRLDGLRATVLSVLLLCSMYWGMVSPLAAQVNPKLDAACLFVRDISASPDPAAMDAAVDSALLVLQAQAERHGCVRLQVMVASSDTIWAARSWVDAPVVPGLAPECAPPKRAKGLGRVFDVVSPVAAASSPLRTPACNRATNALAEANSAAWIRTRGELRRLALGSRPVGGTDTTALLEMIMYASSNRFVAATIVTDAINTKGRGGAGEQATELRTTEVVLVVSPARPRFGGLDASRRGAESLARSVRGLRVINYTDIRRAELGLAPNNEPRGK